MKSRNKIIAGAGGAALVAGIVGMSSFALWSDSADVPAGTITSGTLAVETLDFEVIDISADSENNGNPIDPVTWRASPGDTVGLSANLDVALDGENLAATLDTATLQENIVSADAAEYVTLDFELRDVNGELVQPEADGTYRFQSLEDNSINRGGVEMPNALDQVTDATVVVILSVDEGIPADTLQGVELASFEESGVTLTQVRSGLGFEEVPAPAPGDGEGEETEEIEE